MLPKLNIHESFTKPVRRGTRSPSICLGLVTRHARWLESKAVRVCGHSPTDNPRRAWSPDGRRARHEFDQAVSGGASFVVLVPSADLGGCDHATLLRALHAAWM
jgi:hypothetical protein